MHSLASSLTARPLEFVPVQEALSEKGFALGGGWEYDRGSFDCALDEANTVFLRIPFDVEVGRLDSETANNEAQIKFGRPYVLRHLYNEGLDSEAQARTLGALFDQFSDPVDPDADIDPSWIDAAARKLREVEEIYPA